MARRETVLVTCDMHDDDTEGSTVSYTWDGATYDIDLCDDHRKEFTEALVPYLDASRRGAKARTRTSSPRKATSAPSGGQARGKAVTKAGKTAQEVREVLKAEGYTVGDRGRFSEQNKTDYAHTSGDQFL